MNSSLEVTDNQSQAVAKDQTTRVALADIEANIAHEISFTAGGVLYKSPYTKYGKPLPKSLDVLTICIITMKNGFSVIGKSAPADPQNFNELLGEKFAREDAIRQLWPLMGYELRERLYRQNA